MMKPRSHIVNALGLAVVLSWATVAAADVTIESFGIYKDVRTGMTFVAGKLSGLNAGTFLRPQPLAADSPIAQVAFLPAETACRLCGKKWDGAMRRWDMDDDEEEAHMCEQVVTLWNVVAVAHNPAAKEATINLCVVDPDAGETIENVRWNLEECQNKPPLSPTLFQEWLQYRTSRWKMLMKKNDNAPFFLGLWEQSVRKIYQADNDSYRSHNDWRQPNRDDQMGSLAVFGGQAAIYETLQTQLMRTDPNNAKEETTEDVSIADIPGVEVKAHPYAEMLAELNPEKSLATLADVAPVDRLFVWVQDPRQLAQWLASNAMENFSSLLGEGFMDYGLLDRYAGYFGLTFEQARAWLASGDVLEFALIAPDIFFRDNTDVTLVIRLKRGAKIPFTTKTLKVRGDLLVVSTLPAELDAALALMDKKGEGSLGHLDEFRVMAAKLPLTEKTKTFVYISDPFIRRLTGPETKIGQLRRATCRARLENLTAFALLFRLDHGRDPRDLAELIQFHYVSADDFPSAEFSLAPNCRAVSKTWGSLDRLATLTANPARIAMAKEAEQYKTYRDRYTQFWRDYFDPIAVRLDATAQDGLSLETFILPLVDNSLYTQLRRILDTPSDAPLDLPEYDQPAIASLAFKTTRLPQDFPLIHRSNFQNINPLFAVLGDTLTLSVCDSAPIVQANFPGFSSFAGSTSTRDFVPREMLFAVPFFSALFTRPCDVAIPVSDEAFARKFLQGMTGISEDFYALEILYLDDRDMLLATWVLAGVIRIELGFTVENGWLHITNHPWTPSVITGTLPGTAANASIALSPSNINLGLSQAAALLRGRANSSAAAANAALFPWSEAFHTDLSTALKLQRAALGYATPLAPGAAISNPIHDRGQRIRTLDPVAFPDSIPDIRLNLGFEDDGLRTRAEFPPKTR